MSFEAFFLKNQPGDDKETAKAENESYSPVIESQRSLRNTHLLALFVNLQNVGRHTLDTMVGLGAGQAVLAAGMAEVFFEVEIWGAFSTRLGARTGLTARRTGVTLAIFQVVVFIAP